MDVHPGSQDGRELGLALYSITVRAGATSQPASAERSGIDPHGGE